jgi:hypothetical protein
VCRYGDGGSALAVGAGAASAAGQGTSRDIGGLAEFVS